LNDRRRIVRAFEVYYSTGLTITEQNENSHKQESFIEPLVLGLTYENRELLYERINKRVDIMLSQGLLDEAKSFYESYASKTAVAAIGYKELKPYLDGEKSLEACVEHLKQATRHYAKRQLTWFKRNELINWVYPDAYENEELLHTEVEGLINNFLKGE
jgi:tRNA dimethylallyltransferase